MRPPGYPDDEISQAFFNALIAEDNLGFIIRAHIHIEHELRRLIETAIPNPQYLDIDQLSYGIAIRIVTSLGLNPRFKSPLQALGKLRNRFAHKLDMRIAEKDGDDFYQSFSTEDKKIIRDNYKITREEKKVPNVPFEKLDGRDRITLCLVTLRAALLAAQHQLTSGPPTI
jgi:hypothetical protein